MSLQPEPASQPALPQDASIENIHPGELHSQHPGSQDKPWHKVPSPWWLLSTIAIAAMFASSVIAPQTEFQISLACAELRPEYSALRDGSIFMRPGHSGPSAECKADPAVQEAVATLSTIMTTIYGILSCLTTGWWGKLSDRYGRTRVLGVTAFGSFISICIYILVAFAYDKLPGGYRFLILSSISEGIFGGMAAGAAASHAYISDCSDEITRSGWFSMYYGLLFAGVAFGPTLGAVLIETTGTILPVFYLVAAGYVAYIAFFALVVPESLSVEARRDIADKRRAVAAAREEERRAATTPAETQAGGDSKFLRLASQSLIFLEPLAIFLPRQKAAMENGRKQKDWNLTIVAIAFGIFTLLQGSYPYKFQYAIGMFGWDSVQLGIWLTFIGVGRALNLCVVVPLATKYLKREKQPIALPTDSPESEPLLSDLEGCTAPAQLARHPAQYDLILTRLSVVNEFLCYTILTLSVGPKSWTLGTQLSSFSTGFAPLIQSLALSLVRGENGNENNAGALFGGLSVLQALCSGIVGPFIFGTVYVVTVATFPKTIFCVALSITVITFALLGAVRLPGRAPVVECPDVDNADEQ
ncbi:hypothetical protein BOTBODRAFT_29237 [Botryobasidium botryosum FD-172 SS1]|uniref:Major facilitator superfamily (MFS) profile domain-containing protein n=1 Tax=Botryobasidium botryosum (strain FD-172 SS1) TaxID=930990 RepID=A0A067N2E5_BOTB1|nr:hypothetical protein BOTBODRAFT_29237 [Botryobasidium botryosum FD-172 SS1]